MDNDEEYIEDSTPVKGEIKMVQIKRSGSVDFIELHMWSGSEWRNVDEYLNTGGDNEK